MKAIFSLLVLFLTLVASSGFAKEVRIHTVAGDPVPNYRAVAQSIEPGDVVVSGETRFELSFEPLIGDTDIVARLQDENVIVRLNSFYPPQGDDAVTQIIEGARALEWLNVPHNAVFTSRSTPGRFAVHPYYSGLVPLSEYLKDRANGAVDRAMDEALIRFGESTSAFYYIGDFGTDQISYDGQEWRLMDWTNEHYIAEAVENRHTWSRSGFAGNLDLFENLEKAIEVARVDLSSELPCLKVSAKVAAIPVGFPSGGY